jgi:hypothetical protein
MSAAVTSMKFWLNAFIPGTIAGYTKVLTAGPYAGKTVIPGPPFYGDFLTDNRSFDNDVHASSRMHSEFDLTVDPSDGPKLTQWHNCDETHEIDFDTGVVKDHKKGSTKRMGFTLAPMAVSPMGVPSPLVFTVKMKCAAGNPCVKLAPDIDFVGTITLDWAGRSIALDGLLDAFPAFEGYATINGGAGVMLFKAPPPSGNTVFNLPGDASRPVAVRLQDLDGDGVFETHTGKLIVA